MNYKFKSLYFKIQSKLKFLIYLLISNFKKHNFSFSHDFFLYFWVGKLENAILNGVFKNAIQNGVFKDAIRNSVF